MEPLQDSEMSPVLLVLGCYDLDTTINRGQLSYQSKHIQTTFQSYRTSYTVKSDERNNLDWMKDLKKVSESKAGNTEI